MDQGPVAIDGLPRPSLLPPRFLLETFPARLTQSSSPLPLPSSCQPTVHVKAPSNASEWACKRLLSHLKVPHRAMVETDSSDPPYAIPFL